ncbi:hypothetical protein EV421DRAFT_161761 [Armillaria borealis]|uniref:Uncharacterized protein n=1 Tax=Armillaria borealis TaxID=47425 RepID=A0AA39JTZ1_9AGAR|nr:hypothetical protein EV421DRAFT_161761 [Armillaria borealis]
MDTYQLAETLAGGPALPDGHREASTPKNEDIISQDSDAVEGTHSRIPSASSTPRPANVQDDTLASGLPAGPEPERTSDPLQIAAQVYPWMYMTSTLDACFKDAEATAKRDLETKAKELEAEEANISDERIRFEAERLIEFYDELASDKFAKEAPTIMQLFLSHGDSCTECESEALKIASQDFDLDYASGPSPLTIFNSMMDKLDRLQDEAIELKTRISDLDPPGNDEENKESTAARTQIIPLFKACLPVLRARTANLAMAQQLIEGAKENYSMALHLKMLEMDDSDDYDSEDD